MACAVTTERFATIAVGRRRLNGSHWTGLPEGNRKVSPESRSGRVRERIGVGQQGLFARYR